MAKNKYDELMDQIGASGQKWSPYDLELAKTNPEAGLSIYTQKNAYTNAKTEQERGAANDAAELIRQKYGGYSGGKNGASYTLSDRYAPAAPSYTSNYQNKIDALFSDIQNRDPFSYRPSADPSYQAYSEKYRNLGRESAANALGNAAALTGGQLSSYALTAAQQAQDAYNGRMIDVIPELQRAAYDMYVGDLQQKRNDLSSLMGLEDAAYGRFRDSYDDKVQNWQLNYGIGRDQLEDSRYQDETAYNRKMDEIERNDKLLREAAQTQATNRSGSGGSGAKEQKPTLTYTQAKQLYDDGVYTSRVLEAMTYYTGLDYGKSGSLPTAPKDDRGQLSAKAQKLVSGVERLIEGRDSDYDYVQRTIQNYMQQQILKGESQDAIDEALRALGMDVEW